MRSCVGEWDHEPVFTDIGRAEALLTSHEGRSAGDLKAEAAAGRLWCRVGLRGSSE